MQLAARSVAAMSRNFDMAVLADAIDGTDPDLESAFSIYVAEAVFFADLLGPDLDRLDKPSRVLEIGGGIGLLSMLVAARGHHVTSYEPESAGFAHMARIRRALLDAWTGPAIEVTWVDDYFVAGSAGSPGFDLAYANNVIEHVPQPAQLIEAVSAALRTRGTARFVCANYDFPYEAHIGIPTVISKSLTRRLFARRIANSTVPDVDDFWADLSWPSVRSLRRDLRSLDVKARFHRHATRGYIDRLGADPTFSERKGPFFTRIASVVRPVLSLAARTLPVGVLPVIDLTTGPTLSSSTPEGLDGQPADAIDLTDHDTRDIDLRPATTSDSAERR